MVRINIAVKQLDKSSRERKLNPGDPFSSHPCNSGKRKRIFGWIEIEIEGEKNWASSLKGTSEGWMDGRWKMEWKLSLR